MRSRASGRWASHSKRTIGGAIPELFSHNKQVEIFIANETNEGKAGRSGFRQDGTQTKTPTRIRENDNAVCLLSSTNVGACEQFLVA